MDDDERTFIEESYEALWREIQAETASSMFWTVDAALTETAIEDWQKEIRRNYEEDVARSKDQAKIDPQEH